MDNAVEGWYVDPFGRYDERWFSAGVPTTLVRDAGREAHDVLGPVDVVSEPPRHAVAADSDAPDVVASLPTRFASDTIFRWLFRRLSTVAGLVLMIAGNVRGNALLAFAGLIVFGSSIALDLWARTRRGR